MNSEANKPLGNQSWLADFLSTKGFRPVSPDRFSNGKAIIEFTGNEFTAHPGSGDQAWSSDLEGADCATIKLLIEQILKMGPFVSDADRAKESVEKQRLDQALTGIANSIKEGPDTDSGIQLRRFLWALYNGHHLVNLWRMTCVLDSQNSAWVSDVFSGAFIGPLDEGQIKRALNLAGEMQRWDRVQTFPKHLDPIKEAVQSIDSALQAIPSSHFHTKLKDARNSLLDVLNAFDQPKALSNSEL